MRRKGLVNVLLLTASVFTLASCGNKVDTTYEINLPNDDPTSQVDIHFWHCLGHANADNLEKIVKSFNQKYEGKYNVILDKLSGDYDGLADVVNTRISAGEIPDICEGYPDSFASYITSDIDNSNILKLDNFLNDANVGYSQEELADFVPEYFEEGKHYQFAGTWSMPMYKSTEVMYYNKSYFAGANLPNDKKFTSDSSLAKEYNSLKSKVSVQLPKKADLDKLTEFVKAHDGYTYTIPETWDEMFTLAKKMKDDNKKEGVTAEFYPVGYDSDANMFISQFAQRGIDYTTNDNVSDPSDHILFRNDKAKDFAKEVIGYINDGLMITKGSLGGSTYTNKYFTDVKMAMSIGSTGGSSYQISTNFGVGIAPVPYKGVKKYIQQGPSVCFFNNNDPYKAKGAWLFYKEMAEPVNNAKLALENSYDPIRVSSYDTSEYKDQLKKAGQGLRYDVTAMTATLKSDYMVSPVFLGSATARTEIGKIISYIKNQKMSVDDAFDAAYNVTAAAVR